MACVSSLSDKRKNTDGKNVSLLEEVCIEVDDVYAQHRTDMQRMLDAHAERLESVIGDFSALISTLRPHTEAFDQVAAKGNGRGSHHVTFEMSNHSSPMGTTSYALVETSRTDTDTSVNGVEKVRNSTDSFRPCLQSFSKAELKRRASAILAHDNMASQVSCKDVPEFSNGTIPTGEGSAGLDQWSSKGESNHKVQKNLAERIVESRAFETLTAGTIISNAIFIGVRIQIMASSRSEQDPPMVIAVQHLYSLILVFEVAVRLAAEKKVFLTGPEVKWNVLDCVIVIALTLELIFDKYKLQNSSIVRLVRVFRLLRILRIIRTIRFYRSLRILVYSIFSTVRQLGWTLFLIFLIMYMFGIVFTQGTTMQLIDYANGLEVKPEDFDHRDKLEECYGSLPKAIYSLFKTICGGVDWEEMASPLSLLGWPFVTLFLVYVAFMYFAVLNVVVGVFCNSAIENAQKDQDAMLAEQISTKEAYVEKLTKLFEDLGRTESGVITLHNLETSLENPRMQAWFAMLDIEVDDAWTLFKLLDTGERNVLKIGDFVDGCLRLKGAAKSLDMQRMMYENRWIMNKLVRLSKDVHHVHGQVTHQSSLLSRCLAATTTLQSKMATAALQPKTVAAPSPAPLPARPLFKTPDGPAAPEPLSVSTVALKERTKLSL